MDFCVRRERLEETAWRPAATPALQDGQALLRVDRFGFTANNVTYAVFGEAMQYWNFFPAGDGWGRVPVWGFADVVESTHPQIKPGERLFGYLPMSSQLVVQPERVSAGSFLDGAAHRRALPAAYQLYRRCGADPAYRQEHEDLQALLLPLFVTSFLIEDFIDEQQRFGATQIVLASASSKTALGVAFLLKQRGGAEVVGLTSPGNKAFCEKLGYYDRVLPYDALATLPREQATVFVDMAGDGKLLGAVHQHFTDALKHSCIVGATHWQDRATQHALPGPKPQFFFAPVRYAKRMKDWGAAGVDREYGRAWAAFLPSVQRWLKVVQNRGPQAIEAIYREVLDNRCPPDTAHMLSL
jgi:NADPH:quinone reductase-like Zn-dependent oxidoreductase